MDTRNTNYVVSLLLQSSLNDYNKMLKNYSAVFIKKNRLWRGMNCFEYVNECVKSDSFFNTMHISSRARVVKYQILNNKKKDCNSLSEATLDWRDWSMLRCTVGPSRHLCRLIENICIINMNIIYIYLYNLNLFLHVYSYLFISGLWPHTSRTSINILGIFYS